MNESTRFLKLYTKLLSWEWYDDVNTCRLFIHCLLKANWKSGSWHGIPYEPGQFITSLATLAKETSLTVKQVRVALEHLKRTGEVADLRQSNYRIITVLKWDEYQNEGKPKGNAKANQGQTKGKPRATDIEDIDIKENVDNKNKYYENFALNEAFNEYVKMRKEIKKPMTEHAIRLAIKKLHKLAADDTDRKIEIINQSILNGWQSFYPLKEEGSRQSGAIDWSKV